MCCSPYLGIRRGGGGGGGLPRDWYTTSLCSFSLYQLMHFFTLSSSKIEVFETYFYSLSMTIQDT